VKTNLWPTSAKVADSRRKLLNGGEGMPGYKAGHTSISSISSGKTVCGSDRPQSTGVAGQDEREQQPSLKVEPGNAAIPVCSGISAREEECKC